MSLPNFSFLGSVGQLRYIQACYEAPQFQNPDRAVGAFLSPRQRWGAAARGLLFRARMRANPFYYYLLARTRYYDEIFVSAARDFARTIVNIGCGTDTRAHRFAGHLREKAVRIVECDQPGVIESKRKTGEEQWPDDAVEYVPINLNLLTDSELGAFVTRFAAEPTLIMLEGVSPYVETERFSAFLRTVGEAAHPRTLLAYDYKLTSAAADFGRNDRVSVPFRLGADGQALRDFHAKLGLRVEHQEHGDVLTRRLVPAATTSFNEDGLVRLAIGN